jgi:carbamoyltransferase
MPRNRFEDCMYICGFMNCANKDSGAAIIKAPTKPGEKMEYVAISEERLARVKNSYFSPVRSIKYCMDAFGLKSIEEIDYFAMDWLFEKRLLNSNRQYRKLENDYLMTKLRIPAEKIIYTESHHFAHATSCYYPSGFSEAAILIVDGLGSDMETVSLFHGKGEEIKLVDRAKYYGLGQLYTAITRKILGFSTAEEGKTMGLAPYGANYKGRIFDFQAEYNGLNIDYSRFMDRMPESGFHQDFPKCENQKDVTNEFFSRVAWEAQDEIEKGLMHLAKYAVEKTGCRTLCMAGGVALNCVTNSMILEHGIADRLFVQPASSDTGIPFGLALAGYYEKAKVKTPISFPTAFTSRPYPQSEVDQVLEQFNIPNRTVKPADVAPLIAESNVVGWYVGASEYGPRALGHRSILADPRNPNMRELMNVKVKHREKFRPFAPSVLEERAEDYFHMRGHTSPFMLLAPKVKDLAKTTIPSCVHIDDTARVQTVNPNQNPEYYELISAFHKITGVPVVMNTSFNDNGEPIIETPIDALLCFMRTNIDYLFLQGRLVEKKQIESRKAELLLALGKERDQRLEKQYRESIETTCSGYSPKEMKEYLQRETEKGKYYSNHKTFDDLEDCLTEAEGKKVVLILDHYHDKFLSCHHHLLDRHKNVEKVLVKDEWISSQALLTQKMPDADLYVVLLYNSGIRLIDPLKKLLNKPVFTPYKGYSRKLKPTLSQDKSNSFEHLQKYSFEAQRRKDWDKFFLPTENP